MTSVKKIKMKKTSLIKKNEKQETEILNINKRQLQTSDPLI